MKKTLTGIILFLPILLFGQQTKEIKEINIERDIIEVYNVMISDPSIKNGKYKRVGYTSGETLMEGYYKNNLRDSLWILYGYKGSIDSRGLYSQRKRINVWEYYNSDSKIEQKYNYSKNELIYFLKDTTRRNYETLILTDTGSLKAELEYSPSYKDGRLKMIQFVIKNLNYPDQARRKAFQGTVLISFLIDENGMPHKFYIGKSSGYSMLDEEALRVMKLLPGNWLPGILNGKPITCETTMPIRFALPED